MRIVVQLIENFIGQEIPTIIVSTDHHRYVINVPSSFQRFTREHRIRMPNAATYFFTKISSSTIAGLTGILLTLFDGGYSCNSKIYANDNMFKYLEQLRYKMGFKMIPISYYSWSGLCRRGINSYQMVTELSKRENFLSIFNNLDSYIDSIDQKYHNNAKSNFCTENQIFQDQQIKVIPFHVHANYQMLTNYIFIPKSLPGKILNEKLKEFGIKGKQVSQIQREGKITVNGRIILLQEVKEQDSASPNFVILHINSLQSVHQITSHPLLTKYLQTSVFTLSVIYIVEIAEIIHSEIFNSLMNLFPKDVEHIIYNRNFKNEKDRIEDLLEGSAHMSTISQLSNAFPGCMPNILKTHADHWNQQIKGFINLESIFKDKRVHAYKKNYELVVSPKKSWGYRSTANNVVQQKKLEINLENLTLPQTQIPYSIKKALNHFDPRLIFLGTGSMKPSKYRNVSSILIELTENHSMMLDCGEGSYIQMCNHFGMGKIEAKLLGLRTIFITHIHSDHNLGILDLISQRIKLMKKYNRNDKLFLVLPANVVPWFHAFCESIQNLQKGCQVVFVQSLRNEKIDFEGTMSKEKGLNRFKSECSVKSEMMEEDNENDEEAEDEVNLFYKPEWADFLKEYFHQQPSVLAQFKQYLNKLEIVQFLPVPVIHCPQSYGIVIEHASKIKISYSGDTRPAVEFAKAAQNSTVLIHEATFGDDLAENALAHYHSTVGEAIDIGMKAKSWKTALTHFSQRYKSSSDIVDPKNYKYDKAKETYAENHTVICFDHLQMKMSQTPLMPYYSRAIAKCLPKDNKE